MRRIDINCDLGESFGAWSMGNDQAMMPSITSANIACGFHASDPRGMERTVALCAASGVAVGAHPGFPDLVGFGRRDIKVTPDEARTDVIYQIGALQAFCRARGVKLQHCKPHGQLNNLAYADERLADAIVAGIAAAGPDLVMTAMPRSALRRAAERAGLRVAREVYLDRAVRRDGSLVPRSQPGAVLHDPVEAIDRAVRLVRTGKVRSVEGDEIELEADTICVHGDTPGAPELAARLRAALEAAGLQVRPLGS